LFGEHVSVQEVINFMDLNGDGEVKRFVSYLSFENKEPLCMFIYCK